MSTRLRLVALLAFLLLLPGCADGSEVARTEGSGSPQPPPGAEDHPGLDDDPAPPAAPALPESAPQAAPEPPAVVAERTAEGAEAFARYYYAAVDHAYATGETGLLQRLATEGCLGCAQLVDAVGAIYGAGGSSRGGEATVTAATVTGEPEQGRAEVTLTYRTAPYEELSPEGTVDIAEPEQTGLRSSLSLVHTGDGWRVAELTELGEVGGEPPAE